MSEQAPSNYLLSGEQRALLSDVIFALRAVHHWSFAEQVRAIRDAVSALEPESDESWRELYQRTVAGPGGVLAQLETERTRRIAAEDACAEFVRMQHDIASLLGVDADTDSIDLHGRIYGALSSSQPPAPVRGVDLVTERDHGYAEGYSDAVRWQPIETAPKNGKFQVCLDSCPDLSWPAHSSNGELWSNAHGPLNRMVQGRVTTATHWRPAHSPPTKGAAP